MNYIYTHTMWAVYRRDSGDDDKKKRRKSFLIKSLRRRLSWARQIEDGF